MNTIINLLSTSFSMKFFSLFSIFSFIYQHHLDLVLFLIVIITQMRTNEVDEVVEENSYS